MNSLKAPQLSDLTPAHRVEAESALAAHAATFAGHSAAASALVAPQAAETEADNGTRVWKFLAAQLTYNCTVGEWASKDREVLRTLFGRFVEFGVQLGQGLQAVAVSMTMEESEDDHVHIHFYFHAQKEFHHRGAGALDVFVFEGIHPHVVANQASGSAFKGAVRHGHFYVAADKIGTLFVWADWKPFKDYAVQGWWLDNLLKEEKMSREVYLKYAARIGVGFQRRLADVRAAELYLKEAAIKEAVEEAAGVLATQILPMKVFPEVTRFLDLDWERPRFRRPVLAVVGGTNLGKSMLAAHVVREVGKKVGAAGVLEITVEANPHLDLAEYDRGKHGGVILDGVGDAFILKKNREALQGRPKVCKGGQSATNMYSYPYSLTGRAVVATFDLSAENLGAFEHDHWLQNELNVIVLKLKEKAFVEPGEQQQQQQAHADGSALALPPTPSSSASGQPGQKRRRWVSAARP